MKPQHDVFNFKLQALEASDDGRTKVSGYAVEYGAFNRAGRVFVPGSITNLSQLSESSPVPFGWLHEAPMGNWTQGSDDEYGPLLSGFLSDTTLGRDAAVLLRDGHAALSIGFVPMQVLFAEPDEVVQITVNGKSYTYQYADYALYVLEAEIVETSMVLVGADAGAKAVSVQSIFAKASKAMPGLAADASWQETAYSMALLLGGRGANQSFADVDEADRYSMYQRLTKGYERHGKTPPAFDAEPKYADVQFQHDERAIFSERYLRKTLATVVAGAAGIEGPLSLEARDEITQAAALLGELASRKSPLEIRVAEMTASLRQTLTTLKD